MESFHNNNNVTLKSDSSIWELKQGLEYLLESYDYSMTSTLIQITT